MVYELNYNLINSQEIACFNRLFQCKVQADLSQITTRHRRFIRDRFGRSIHLYSIIK